MTYWETPLSEGIPISCANWDRFQGEVLVEVWIANGRGLSFHFNPVLVNLVTGQPSDVVKQQRFMVANGSELMKRKSTVFL